jgi:hypothetical protein
MFSLVLAMLVFTKTYFVRPLKGNSYFNIQNRAIQKFTHTLNAQDSRILAEGVSLDMSLVANNPELVVSHYKSRRASDQIFDDIEELADLRKQRSLLIQEGDEAKKNRKVLSQQIGDRFW